MIDMHLDIGQTSARARLAHDDEVVSELENLPGFVSGADVSEAIATSVSAAAASFGVTRVDRVGVGASGVFGVVPSVERLAESLDEALSIKLVRVADDGVTAFLGALDGSLGAMVAAGTGIVALGLGVNGVARADGVGAMLGDEGSGWWIGRAGLIAAISSVDGRPNGSPMLLDAAVARYGPVASIPIAIASSSTPIATTAAFAVDVAEAARAGDPTALQIWADAATHIGDALIAVAEQAGLDSAFDWCIVGRLALSRDLLEPALGDRLHARFPLAQWKQAVSGPLDGIRNLLRLDSLRDFGPMAAEHRP